jgi:hypothetical protein
MHSEIYIKKVLHAGSDTNVRSFQDIELSVLTGHRRISVLNLVYIAAEFNCIYTWIHLLIESSVPLATSPLVQNGNRVCTEPSAETLCTDWKSISLSYPAAIRTFRSILMGILEGSFIGRERTGFPKTVILHLSIRVGDSTIPLPRVPENCDDSFRNCFFICVIYNLNWYILKIKNVNIFFSTYFQFISL